MSYKLLSVSADPKTVKGEAFGYLTGILYLAPASLSGRNLCPDSTPGCRAGCLNTAGRGVYKGTQNGRIRRSVYFREDRPAFMADLVSDIKALIRKADRMGLTPLVRLNGTSDIPWENVPTGPAGASYMAPLGWRNVMAQFPDVLFYDYTKSFHRMVQSVAARGDRFRPWPQNYSLTFSRSECNDPECRVVLQHRGNVSVVFSTKRGDALPEWWEGYPVADGDISDARPSDMHGYVIGLRAKGRARRDRSGFVVEV